MTPVTNAEFERFKRAFRKYRDLFGLTGWRVTFGRGVENDGNYAELHTNNIGRVASVSLCTELSEMAREEWKGPEATGRHEAIHLLTADLDTLATWRYIRADEINMAEEALVRRIEDALLALEARTVAARRRASARSKKRA